MACTACTSCTMTRRTSRSSSSWPCCPPRPSGSSRPCPRRQCASRPRVLFSVIMERTLSGGTQKLTSSWFCGVLCVQRRGRGVGQGCHRSRGHGRGRRRGVGTSGAQGVGGRGARTRQCPVRPEQTTRGRRETALWDQGNGNRSCEQDMYFLCFSCLFHRAAGKESLAGLIHKGGVCMSDASWVRVMACLAPLVLIPLEAAQPSID